ncbi:MAG: class I SAM-dependent methyltransferase [Armatimonadota bacterium]|nr:class I SAM-dependent methyltransferase [Armatimonadota bacterium]MCX7778288.1 class I SAM-dependent methyltransferase [Armatimonadota bacterium]MDW8026324.1 class I SAM-dependent methyltransferase [Armatimonadota bacterium]
MTHASMLRWLICPDDGGSLTFVNGLLMCNGCGRAFEVDDNIVRILPRQLMEPSSDSELQKLREQKTRDEQASWYDMLIGLKLVELFEMPIYRKLLGTRCYDVALEIGCGTGRVTVELVKRVKHLFALDLSYASLELCRKRLKRSFGNDGWLLLHGDANSLPIRDESCDLVFSAQAIEHVPGKHLQCEVFYEVARVLKPSSPFVFSIYHWSWLMKLFSKREGYHKGGIYFYRWNAEELKQALSKHFEVEYIRPCAGYILIVRALKRANGNKAAMGG